MVVAFWFVLTRDRPLPFRRTRRRSPSPRSTHAPSIPFIPEWGPDRLPLSAHHSTSTMLMNDPTFYLFKLNLLPHTGHFIFPREFTHPPTPCDTYFIFPLHRPIPVSKKHSAACLCAYITTIIIIIIVVISNHYHRPCFFFSLSRSSVAEISEAFLPSTCTIDV